MRNSESNGKKPIQEVESMRQQKLKTERLRRKVTWQKKIQEKNGLEELETTRRTGIDIIDYAPWGTHLCLFYQDKQDLIDILVPYFKEGLENNEFCIWITSEPLNSKDAYLSLRQAVNNLDDYIEKGQIEILDYNHWYTKSGKFDADTVIRGWMEKYEQAAKRKFDGLRITGNTFQLQKEDWRQFAEYERTIDELIGRHKMLAICTYCLDTSGASQVVDVVSSHKLTVIKRQGKWELVENSQLKNTNRALQNALKQWEATFNITQDSIILIDPDFRILKANMATSKLLGKPLDDILGSKCYELFHGTNAPPDICPHRKVKETKKHEETELYIPDKDIWIAISTDPILDDNGNINGTVHVVRNITEHKKALEQIGSAEELFKKTFLSLDSAAFILDDKTPPKITDCNPAATKLFGYEREEFLGKTTQFLHTNKKALKEFQNVLYPAIEKQGFLSFYEYRMKRKNGVVFPTEHSVLPLKNERNNRIGWISIVRDISARKEMEKQLRQSKEFLANTINALEDTFFVKDEEHRWTVLNDAACEAIGRPREELIGKSDYDVVPKEQADVFWEKDNLVLDTGETNVSEEEVTWRGKLHTISTNKSLFKDFITGKRFIVGIARDITVRKQMEKTLRESEQKYRALVEQSMYGIVILQDFRIVFANSVAAKISGLKMEELHNLSFEDMMEFIPPENRSTIQERLKNRFAGRDNVPQNYELRLLRKNGEEFWLNLFFSPIEYKGRPAIQLAFTDITERKRAEEALRRSEKRFREFFENTAVGVYRTTPDGQILMANPALVHMLGYSSFEELSQRNLEEEGFEPQYSRSIFKEEIERKGRIVSWESIWKTRDNKTLYVIENARAVKDEDGRILCYEGTAENITERKRVEKELKQSKEFLSNAINAIDDPFFAKDEEHRWTVLNDAACKVMGRPREELIGKSDYDLFAKEQADVFWERDNHVLETGQTDVNEEEITWHGKLHTISTKKSIFTDSITGKKFIVGTIRDITERKKAEETLKESEEKFRNLAEQSPNMIFINKRGRVVYANKKCEETMGYKREEFYHPDFDFMTLIAPEFKQLIKTNLNRHMKGEEIKPYEYGLITKDGERLDAIITTKLMKYEGEDSILGTITDITERKKAQEEIAKLAKFPAEDPNPVLRISKDGTILYANNTSSIVLDTWGRKVGERLPSACGERIKEAFRTRTASTFEFHCHNGQIFEVKLVPIVESGYANAYGLDITERKQAEEKLKIREQTLRAFLNAPTESAILVDTEGTILDINRIAAQRLGKSSEELIGMDIYDYLPAHIAESRKAKGAEVIRSGKPLRFHDEREGRHYDNNVYPVFNDEGRVSALAVFSGDVTERKQAEEKLRDYQEQLKSLASQLTLVEERERHRIATELHDEISQSLFISKMKLEALHKSVSDKKSEDTLDEISNSLGQIIGAMRSLTFDLSSPILYEFGFEEAVAEWLNERVEKKYGIATELEDDGLPKQMDDDIRILLFRNVRELLINVVKHSRAKKIKVSIQKVGSRIRVSVEDDGVGFDPTKAESMITSKEAFGLFSIRERLEHLGGNLNIKSASGCGCRVTITSPLKREDTNKDKQK